MWGSVTRATRAVGARSLLRQGPRRSFCNKQTLEREAGEEYPVSSRLIKKHADQRAGVAVFTATVVFGWPLVFYITK
ncbi:hypothetical protein BWQ96_02678 [Gracilariopsis chorda]|uniref:Uncharacterized protein n=1 Tax=Gracilariopsis chorda TaxID=448386 RepID=A0A2V3IZG5_9FLOR|nr:hypothetical protein BWQ96_02678 [Gracilariopsis chorda]|eukprot:PXF47534.1 hypothetical protein BWQ96_02678 [Gracilariopsis chorda]